MIRNKRIKYLAVAITTIFLMLILRLVYIQIIKGDELASMAISQHSHTGSITDVNYMILDDKGKSLLKFKECYRIVIDTVSFKRNNSSTPIEELYTFKYVLENYNSEYNIENDLKSVSEGKRYYDVDKETYEKIDKLTDIKGIYKYRYSYVDRNSAWDICNMMASGDGEDKTLEEKIKKYTAGNTTPTIYFSKDSSGNIGDGNYDIPDSNVNIKLTLDCDMIQKVKSILNEDRYEKYSQIGVALCESDSGKIKVLCQKDETQPNIMLASTTENGYSPGSIFKMIVLEAGLNEGILSINDKFTCQYNSKFPCKISHGTLTVDEAFVKSCNNIFAEIGNELGSDKIIEYAKKQGLFSKVLNFSGDKEVSGDYVISKADEGGATNISIGQNMRIAPIQALGMLNTVVNGGIYVKPYIIDKLENNNFDIIEEFSSEVHQEAIKPSVAQKVKNELVKVIKSHDGTGQNAYIPGIEAGGKTGTATRMEPKMGESDEASQNSVSDMEEHYDGWFAGYYKYKDKNYSLVIFVKDIGNEEEGGSTAAPLFKEIVEKLAHIK